LAGPCATWLGRAVTQHRQLAYGVAAWALIRCVARTVWLLHRDANQLEHLALGPHVAVHRLTSTPGTGLVAVRPDGYVGLRCRIADAPQLRGWLARIGAAKSADIGDPPRRSRR
jgi:hypothetical protein